MFEDSGTQYSVGGRSQDLQDTQKFEYPVNPTITTYYPLKNQENLS